jgi:hypothetical protein
MNWEQSTVPEVQCHSLHNAVANALFTARCASNFSRTNDVVCGGVGQRLERLLVTQEAAGSSPVPPAISIRPLMAQARVRIPQGRHKIRGKAHLASAAFLTPEAHHGSRSRKERELSLCSARQCVCRACQKTLPVPDPTSQFSPWATQPATRLCATVDTD